MATPILMPRQGQSVESCIIVEWKVKPGDAVKTGDIVASIETDKAVFDVESPIDGTILELFFQEGDDVPVLTHIAAVGNPGEDASDLRPGGGQSPEDGGLKPEVGSQGKSEKLEVESKKLEVKGERSEEGSRHEVGTTSHAASPRARKRAGNEGLDVSALAGTGPGGRVIERDVIAAAVDRGRISPAAKAAAQTGGLRAPSIGSGPGGMVLTADLRATAATAAPKEIPVKGIRKIIAERMKASLTSTAQLTLYRSFNASSIQVYRTKVKKHGELFGIPPVTINDIIVYAAVRTLLRHPDLNAHFLGNKILQYPNVHVGIAVDTPRGLMVPVVHNADQMNLTTLSGSIRPLAKACQEGNIQPDLLSGGTFTITNLGSLGIESFTPVLNAPEVAILGVGGIFLKPVKTAHGVEHVDAMNLSLTIDHQAVDGAPGARFLQDLALTLENIELLLSEDVVK